MYIGPMPAPRQRCACVFIAGVLAWGMALSAACAAQGGPVQSLWFQTLRDSMRDSVRVDAVLPHPSSPRPAIVVLSDRFGMQPAVDAILRILAGQGYRAYALPLRSAPTQLVTGIPPLQLDSLDVDVLTQVAIDIRNDSDCTGTVGLLAFDAGAVIGALAQARLPLFASCCLFYPADAALIDRVLPRLGAPSALHIGEYDPEMTLARVNGIRERCIDNGLHLTVRFYKGARPFFFNPRHEHYSSVLTTDAWKAVFSFFSTTLR